MSTWEHLDEEPVFHTYVPPPNHDFPADEWYDSDFPDLLWPALIKYHRKLAWAGRAASLRWAAAIKGEREVATLDDVDFKIAVFDKAYQLCVSSRTS
jgi:hypothetical protein